MPTVLSIIKTASFCIAFILISCGNPPAKSKADMQSSESTSPKSQTRCFLHTDGNQNQDTTFLQLEINGDAVTGVYNVVPFQKDARKGTFTGIVKNGIIQGTWVFMQEGIIDSLPAEFKQNGDGLLSKNYNFDTGTGKEFLSDTARFSTNFVKVTCK